MYRQPWSYLNNRRPGVLASSEPRRAGPRQLEMASTTCRGPRQRKPTALAHWRGRPRRPCPWRARVASRRCRENHRVAAREEDKSFIAPSMSSLSHDGSEAPDCPRRKELHRTRKGSEGISSGADASRRRKRFVLIRLRRGSNKKWSRSGLSSWCAQRCDASCPPVIFLIWPARPRRVLACSRQGGGYFPPRRHCFPRRDMCPSAPPL
jgi:hypothetical protein